MANALLLTGPPASGKTTMVAEVLSKLDPKQYHGFFTREVRTDGDRIGFDLVTTSGVIAPFARLRPHSDQFSGAEKYIVDMDRFENLCLQMIREHLGEDRLLVMDEIGPMQLESDGFCKLCREALQTNQLLFATVVERPHPFADWIKQIDGVTLFTITPNNRQVITRSLLAAIQSAGIRLALGQFGDTCLTTLADGTP